MSEEKQKWQPAGIYTGVFDGFVVHANRHISEEREQTAWHTTSYNNSGDQSHRDYWVVEGQFRKTLRQTLDTREVTTGDIIEDSPDVERRAILKAIAEWSTQEPSTTP